MVRTHIFVKLQIPLRPLKHAGAIGHIEVQNLTHRHAAGEAGGDHATCAGAAQKIEIVTQQQIGLLRGLA